MEDSPEKMTDFLTMYGVRPADNSSREWLKSTIGDKIEKDAIKKCYDKLQKELDEGKHEGYEINTKAGKVLPDF